MGVRAAIFDNNERFLVLSDDWWYKYVGNANAVWYHKIRVSHLTSSGQWTAPAVITDELDEQVEFTTAVPNAAFMPSGAFI